jgi:hypothetical protein
MITEWLEAQGPQNTELLKTFVNTRLAETWELRGEGAEQSELENAPMRSMPTISSLKAHSFSPWALTFRRTASKPRSWVGA